MTQLYVSVDASTKDSLKKIDRPLFKDFWQRFLDSLTALSDKVSLYIDSIFIFVQRGKLSCFLNWFVLFMFHRNLDWKTKKESVTLFAEVLPLGDVFRALSNIYGEVFAKKVNG